MRTTAWLVALVVPISFAVTILAWSGALQEIAAVVAPVFGLFGVPESTAVAFVTGALVNCYSAIAAFSAIPLTGREVTILAFMVLVCHNLLVESPIQRRAGSSAVAMAFLRLGGAVAGGLLLNLVLPADAVRASTSGVTGSGGALVAGPLPDAVRDWAFSTAKLVLKIGVIVISLSAVQKVLDEMGLIRLLARALNPLMSLLGLSAKAAFPWLVANTLGLAYGGGIIVSEVKEGRLEPREVHALNISVALCHSLLEDTILFAAVGANALWITLPRLAMAGAAVWAYRLFERSPWRR